MVPPTILDFDKARVASARLLHLKLHINYIIIAPSKPRGDSPGAKWGGLLLHLELREITQRGEVGGPGIGLERELEDLVEPPGQARQQWSVGARR